MQGSLASEPAGPTPAEPEHHEQDSASEAVLLPPGQKNEQRMGEDLMMTSKTHQRCEASATVQQQLEAVFGRGKLEGGAGEGGASRRPRGRCAMTGPRGHMRLVVLWLWGSQGQGQGRVSPAHGRSISRWVGSGWVLCGRHNRAAAAGCHAPAWLAGRGCSD